MRILIATLAACILHTQGRLATNHAEIDVGGTGTAFRHIWKEAVGSSHAKLGERDDWRAQLKVAVDKIGFKGIRFHGIFDDEMGVVTGTWQHPVYNFSQTDTLIDFLVSLNLKPIMELSFMPSVLANCKPNVNCTTQFAYNLIKMPPFEEKWYLWHDLVKAFVTHITARYGAEEIRAWRFEVWNEMWGIDFPAQYMPLYNASAVAVRSVDAAYRVGGPTTMELLDIPAFYNMSQEYGGADYVTTHCYPIDQCPGNPDRDCFADGIAAARRSFPRTTPMYITEYSSGWKDPAFRLSTYFAASFVAYSIPAVLHDLDVFSWWAFSDVFMEDGMPTKEWEGESMGLQTLYGVAKPSFRTHEFFKDVGSHYLNVAQDVGPKDSGVKLFATTEGGGDGGGGGLRIVATFFDSPQLLSFANQTINTTVVTVTLKNSGLEDGNTATLRMINSTCANTYQAWQDIGSPGNPTPTQLDHLHQKSEPCSESLALRRSGDTVSFEMALESFATALITFDD